jgi:hypothetical protein
MNSKTEKGFSLARWIKVCFLGWLIGVVLILLLSSALDAIGKEHMQFYLGIGMGAGVGIAQWFLLKKWMSISTCWKWFSALGLGIPFIVIDLMPTFHFPPKLPLSMVLGSLSAGLLQFNLLKSFSTKAWLWIPGTMAGWTMAVATVFAVDYTKMLSAVNWVLAIINLLLILGGGVVLGLITGMVLRKILP